MGLQKAEESTRDWKPVWKIIIENFSNPVKEIHIQVQEVQSPKQDEPKEAHTKTHYK